jgi:hypothetical protein
LIIDTVNMSPRAFWKEHERDLPALSSLARDVLAIPASGAGVERLFNSARDICHYRRGQLERETIKDLMMWMCATRFEVEQQRLDLMGEYLLASEVAATEESAPSQTQLDFEPISDNEEEDSGDVQTETLGRPRKRYRTITTEEGQEEELPVEQPHESDDETEYPFPENGTQGRGSKRVRKAPKGFEDYEIIKP